MKKTQSHWQEGGIATLHDAYRSGLTVGQVVLESLDSARNGPSPVWLSLRDTGELIQRARVLDAEIDRFLSTDELPLFGVIFAVKDNIDVAGCPTTAGCPGYAYIPEQSSFVVKALEEAGAVALGKTHMDQFATGLVGVRHPDGACPNATNPEFIAGGSSSGSAVAVALKQVQFSLGTDTAGSGRVPAAFNGLVGLKPTRGRLSTAGVVPACATLDCVSVFAQNAADARLVLDVAGKYNPEDPWARPRISIANTGATVMPDNDESPSFRFGILSADALDTDEGEAEYYQAAIERLEKLGGEAVTIDYTPFAEAAGLLYDGPWIAERYAAVGEFIEANSDAVFGVTKDIILAGKTPAAAKAFQAMYRLRKLRRKTETVWLSGCVKFVLTPGTPGIYTIDEVNSDPVRLNSRLGTYTNFMNLLDLSAVAVPAGVRDGGKADGLPYGVTIFAPAGSDETLLCYTEAFMKNDPSKLPGTGSAVSSGADESAKVIPVMVCGAHMDGMPLNGELTERGASIKAKTKTAPAYRFYALPSDDGIDRPGLVRVADTGPVSTAALGEGKQIEVEVWNLPTGSWGAFMAGIPEPLCIGSVELEDGSWVKGFLCEGRAVAGAKDITHLGGWRGFIESKG